MNNIEFMHIGIHWIWLSTITSNVSFFSFFLFYLIFRRIGTGKEAVGHPWLKKTSLKGPLHKIFTDFHKISFSISGKSSVWNKVHNCIVSLFYLSTVFSFLFSRLIHPERLLLFSALCYFPLFQNKGICLFLQTILIKLFLE